MALLNGRGVIAKNSPEKGLCILTLLLAYKLLGDDICHRDEMRNREQY